THIYTRSLHDALPISCECGANSRVPLFGAARTAKSARPGCQEEIVAAETAEDTNCLREKLCFLLMVSFLLAAAERSLQRGNHNADRKSTRLNSSHVSI